MDATFKRLLVNLERGSEHNTKIGDIEAALERNFEHLLNPLRIPPPNPTSRNRIQTAVEFELRGTKHTLDKPMRDFIINVSDLLQLDEFDSFILFLNLLQYELKEHMSLSRTTEPGQNWRQTTLVEIFDYFFEEKLCLLLCLGSLFRIADDSEEIY